MTSMILLTCLLAMTQSADLLPTQDQSTAPGVGLERTLHLLQSSSASKPNTVRILVYGQSISDQSRAWSKMVVANLQAKYPTAVIELKNLAIGGFAADLLKQTAIGDIRSWNPDLIMLHDYGGDPDYAELVQNLMSQTHAELLMQSDHYNDWPSADENKNRGIRWHNGHVGFLKDLAVKHGFGMIDVRYHWYRYLVENNLKPRQLTSDDIHPNERGDKLLAEIILRAFDAKSTGDPRRRVITRIIQPSEWKSGRLKLDIKGYRVEVSGPLSADVLIDGTPPSKHAELYWHTRPDNAYKMWFPILLRIDPGSKPVAQTYKAKIVSSATSRDFSVEVSGSVSGPEGVIKSKDLFESRSGGFVIKPEYWVQWYGDNTPPVGMEFGWQSKFNGMDRVEGGSAVIASGLKGASHTVEFRAKKTPTSPITVTAYLPSFP
jgi:hypothetical protein